VPRSLPAAFALLLFGLFLAVAVPQCAWRAAQQIGGAARFAGESPLERRRRVFGPEYAEGIEAIRRAIPPDGAYILVNGATADEGARLWVRFDLAPRRAVFAGGLRGLRNPRNRGRIPPDLAWVVVARGRGGAPELMDRQRFLARLRQGDAR
jgi:hypothetical protein